MRYNPLLASLAAATLLTGCGLFNFTSTSTKDYSRTDVDSAGSSQANDNEPATADEGDLASQLYGEWNFVTVGGRDISTSERAFINFDFEQNRLYGCSGCNIINADFEASTTGLSFHNIITTMMECDNATSERTVMKALEQTASYKLYRKDGSAYLCLLNSSGNALTTLRRQNLDFLNGAWTVKEINGTPTLNGDVRLVIDIDQLKIHGNTGCNIVNGVIYIDTDKEHAIQFQQLISTMKSCPDMSLETELLVALEETSYCKEVSETDVQLINRNGEVMVVLTRLDLRET